MVVDEPGKGGDTSITTASQQQQEARVGALIEAVWGQPEVLSELEAHPKFLASWGRKLDNNDNKERDGSGRAEEEDENEEGEDMSDGNSREATVEDQNEGDMSVEASAEVQNKRRISDEASAEGENDGEISVVVSAKDEIDGRIPMDPSAEEENPPTSGHSYSTQEEEVPTISFPFLFRFVFTPPNYIHPYKYILTFLPPKPSPQKTVLLLPPPLSPPPRRSQLTSLLQ